jgi:integrase
MRIRLTDAKLRNLPPAEKGKRTKIWDELVRELVCIVSEKGTKSLMVSAKVPGGKRAVRRLIGHHGSVLIDQARTEAREHLATIRKGLDPKVERERTVRRTAQEKALPFRLVVEEWLEAHASKLRRAKEYRRVVAKELMPYWADRLVCDIGRDDVVRRISEVGRRAPYVGWSVFGVIRSFFSWAVAGPYGLTISPVEQPPRIRPAKILGPRKARTRELSDLELRAYVKACHDFKGPYGSFFLGLLYCAQRLRELADADWSEFELEGSEPTFIVPASRAKNGIETRVPMSRQFVKVMRSLPRYKSGTRCFTCSFGKTSINSMGWATVRLKALMLDHMRAEKPDAALPAFGLHDLRRTARSRAAMLGVSYECGERMLGHLVGSAVHRTYNRYGYEKELRAAFQMWADHVDEVASGGVVVPIIRAG